jgi:hypothetical protein
MGGDFRKMPDAEMFTEDYDMFRKRVQNSRIRGKQKDRRRTVKGGGIFPPSSDFYDLLSRPLDRGISGHVEMDNFGGL